MVLFPIMAESDTAERMNVFYFTSNPWTTLFLLNSHFSFFFKLANFYFLRLSEKNSFHQIINVAQWRHSQSWNLWQN